MRLALSTPCLLSLVLFAAANHAAPAPEENEPIFVCPLPKCGKCPSKERVTAPGVGFALEIGYGHVITSASASLTPKIHQANTLSVSRTVSIKYNNGTVIPVAQIKGTPEYVVLTQHLATSPIKRMTDGSRPPLGVDESDNSTWPVWIRFRIKRFLNKLLWRPATPEIGVLAEMVLKLRREAEVRLGRRIKGAALASPDQVRLTRQEITDVFDYLWMEDLVRDKNNVLFSELFSTAAASAGYGVGLCANYTNAYQCAKEELISPHRWMLQLDYSNHSLNGAMDLSNTARRSSSHNTFVDLKLGSDHLCRESVSEDEYWAGLETRIREFVGSRRPDTLLLTGESASDSRFLQIVKDVLASPALPLPRSKSLKGAISEQSEHFLFATSMGAAEFAKRRQEGMARCFFAEDCPREKSIEEVVENLKEL